MERRGLLRFLKDISKNRKGSVITYAALIVPVVVGAAGLSVDVAGWHMQRRALQSAADSAAMAGALELLRTDPTKVDAAVKTDAKSNGFKDGIDGINIENPPPPGSIRAGSTDSVMVTITRTVQPFLSGVISGGPVTIQARATAYGASNDTCVWSLNPNTSGAVDVSGGAQVNLGCGTFVNSNASDGLTQGGSSCLTTTEIKASGGISDGGCINTNTTSTGVPQINDPLSWVDAPSYGGCDYNNKVKVQNNKEVWLNPGVYCNGIEVQPGGIAHFNPGIYTIFAGGLDIQGEADGTEVSFYLSEFNSSNDGIKINSSASVNLSATTSGEMAGILIYVDRNAPEMDHTINGSADMDLQGVIYMPNGDLKFAGGSALDASASMIIADTVKFTGNTEIGGFAGTPVETNPLLVTATLAE